MNTLNHSEYHIIPQNPHPYSVEDYRTIIKTIMWMLNENLVKDAKDLIEKCKNKGMI